MENEPIQRPKIEKPDLDMDKLEELVTTKVEQFKKLPIIMKAFEILNDLPDDLYYHNLAHTEDVLHETILFGIVNGRSEAELERNAVASVWHDTGFTKRRTENEEIAVELFEEAIRDNPPEYAESVKTIILDTTVRKTDKGYEIIMSDPISGNVLDADVSNFGRPDFWEKRRAIAVERGVNWENTEERLVFLKDTLSFIKNHDWKTEGARILRQEQKLKNIAEMEKEIALLSSNQA